MTATRCQARPPWRPLLVAALAVLAFVTPATAASALWSTTTTTTLSVATSPAVVPPAAPSGLSCPTPSSKRVNVSWTAVTGLTYDLVLGTGTPVKSAVSPPVTLTGADVSGAATVFVRATNTAGWAVSSQYFDISIPTGQGNATCAVKP